MADEVKPAADARRRATRIKAGSLLKAVKDVGGVVEGRNTIPILAFLLLEARDGTIALTGTNLDCWAQRTIASDDRDGPGSADWVNGIRPFIVTLPAKALQDVLAEIDREAMVTIEAPVAGDHRVTLRAGRSRFRLNCLPPEDCVPLPGFEGTAAFELDCTALADCFAAVEHAISTEETRYYLNGVFVHFHQADAEAGELRFVATDGSRLARLAVDCPEGATSFPDTIIRRDTVALLDRLLAEAAKDAAKERDVPAPRVLVEANGTGLLRYSFEHPDGDVLVIAKTVDGSFPDYQRVIPSAPAHFARIERGPLADALKRVGVLASDKTRAVKAIFTDDRLELVVSTPDLGEAREELPCSYEGPEFTIGFNGQYWRAGLLALASEDVSMGLPDGAMGPTLLRPFSADGKDGRLVQVLMPLRV